jgi:hypothetical protein
MQDAVLMKNVSRHRRATTRCSFFFIPGLLDVENGENDTASDFLSRFVRVPRGSECSLEHEAASQLRRACALARAGMAQV